MRIISALGVIAICLVVHQSPSLAADAANKVPDFLFAEDNQIAAAATQEQLNAAVKAQDILRSDKWLNEPFTRLDYVMMNIASDLKGYQSNAARVYIKDYFHEYELWRGLLSPSVEVSARYSDEKGRLVIGMHVGQVGKPKKPIKEFCQTLLGMMESVLGYPQKPPLGYTWQNKVLGLLMREDADKYETVVQKLAKKLPVYC